ncbi:MAG: hypothetical protein Q7S64_01455 [bacterium]|nr:hypothetical protein [bacterium]
MDAREMARHFAWRDQKPNRYRYHKASGARVETCQTGLLYVSDPIINDNEAPLFPESLVALASHVTIHDIMHRVVRQEGEYRWATASGLLHHYSGKTPCYKLEISAIELKHALQMMWRVRRGTLLPRRVWPDQLVTTTHWDCLRRDLARQEKQLAEQQLQLATLTERLDRLEREPSLVGPDLNELPSEA